MKNTLLKKAHAHNTAVDDYINVTLRDYFGGDKITAAQWFEAQTLIRKQNFYKKGITYRKKKK